MQQQDGLREAIGDSPRHTKGRLPDERHEQHAAIVINEVVPLPKQHQIPELSIQYELQLEDISLDSIYDIINRAGGRIRNRRRQLANYYNNYLHPDGTRSSYTSYCSPQ
ncbi:unnamed protein product [Spodoptera exigua]|nr:unnamed protein product [Spodoptera exigua]